MCGINKIYAHAGVAGDSGEREYRAATDAMSERGPDGSGFYRDPSGCLLLGHRRLAIIDITEQSAYLLEQLLRSKDWACMAQILEVGSRLVGCRLSMSMTTLLVIGLVADRRAVRAGWVRGGSGRMRSADKRGVSS